MAMVCSLYSISSTWSFRCFKVAQCRWSEHHVMKQSRLWVHICERQIASRDFSRRSLHNNQFIDSYQAWWKSVLCSSRKIDMCNICKIMTSFIWCNWFSISYSIEKLKYIHHALILIACLWDKSSYRICRMCFIPLLLTSVTTISGKSFHIHLWSWGSLNVVRQLEISSHHFSHVQINTFSLIKSRSLAIIIKQGDFDCQQDHSIDKFIWYNVISEIHSVCPVNYIDVNQHLIKCLKNRWIIQINSEMQENASADF